MKEKEKFTFLLIFGIALAVFMIFLGIGWQPRTLKKPSFPEQPPSFEDKVAHAAINFNPPQLAIHQNEELKIEILLKSENPIVGADLNFKFEPTILEIKQIKPGNFFSKPQEIKKIINAEKGEIFYSLGSFSSQRGEAVLAELIFKAKKPGTTEVALDEGTQIAAEKTAEVKIDLPVLGKYIILE
jgi:hypothetical protein